MLVAGRKCLILESYSRLAIGKAQTGRPPRVLPDEASVLLTGRNRQEPLAALSCRKLFAAGFADLLGFVGCTGACRLPSWV